MTSDQPLQAAIRTDQLADALADVAAAIDQARSVGLAVDVPEQLYRACREIIYRRADPPPTGRSSPSSFADSALGTTRVRSADAPGVATPRSSLAREHPPVLDVPLRRLLWQVLDPGERFTVNDVVKRLATMGVDAPPSAVSNALGYWVSRQRLSREKKGVYRYPTIPVPVDAALEADTYAEPSEAGHSRVQRKDTKNVSVHETKAKAM
jgi:hypothetical protein